jgi:hypothetical protein
MDDHPTHPGTQEADGYPIAHLKRETIQFYAFLAACA